MSFEKLSKKINQYVVSNTNFFLFFDFWFIISRFFDCPPYETLHVLTCHLYNLKCLNYWFFKLLDTHLKKSIITVVWTISIFNFVFDPTYIGIIVFQAVLIFIEIILGLKHRYYIVRLLFGISIFDLCYKTWLLILILILVSNSFHRCLISIRKSVSRVRLVGPTRCQFFWGGGERGKLWS